MLGQRVEFAGHLVGRADEVGLVGVLRHQAEGLALPTTSDHHRDLRQGSRRVNGVGHVIPAALHGRSLPGQHPLDDLQRLLQPLEAVGESAELEAEAVVLELEPAGTDAELGTPAGDMVEGGELLGQQSRVPVGVAGDQGRQAHTVGVLGQRRQQRVALEHLVLGRPEHGQLVEVVHHQHGVEA